MKTIMIPNEYTNTLQGFVDWFTDEFKPCLLYTSDAADD